MVFLIPHFYVHYGLFLKKCNYEVHVKRKNFLFFKYQISNVIWLILLKKFENTMHIICYKKNLQIPESKKIMQQFLIAMMFYELHYTYK